jgi:hypothetical protein
MSLSESNVIERGLVPIIRSLIQYFGTPQRFATYLIRATFLVLLENGVVASQLWSVETSTAPRTHR